MIASGLRPSTEIATTWSIGESPGRLEVLGGGLAGGVPVAVGLLVAVGLGDVGPEGPPAVGLGRRMVLVGID